MWLLLACAAAPGPENGAPMDGLPDRALAAGDWHAEVRDGVLTVSGRGATRELGRGVLHELAFHGDQLAWPALDATGEADLWRVRLPEGEVERLTDWEGYEDRPVWSPDGARLAFFSGRTGLPSLYVMDLASGEVLHLTNVGLENAPRRPGVPPDGFVPPPDGLDLRWEGDTVSWTARGAPVAVRVP